MEHMVEEAEGTASQGRGPNRAVISMAHLTPLCMYHLLTRACLHHKDTVITMSLLKDTLAPARSELPLPHRFLYFHPPP